jgi:hypothetical protein
MDGLLDRTLGGDPVHQGSSTSRLDLPADERADQFMTARDRPSRPPASSHARIRLQSNTGHGSLLTIRLRTRVLEQWPVPITFIPFSTGVTVITARAPRLQKVADGTPAK